MRSKVIGVQFGISDVIKMREDGMTIGEIAKALDVCTSTVSRCLNNNGKHYSRQYTHRAIKVEDKPDTVKAITETFGDKLERAMAEKQKPAKVLKVLSQQMTLEGALCNYFVDISNGEIEMNNGTISGLLSRDTLAAFITELQELQSMI